MSFLPSADLSALMKTCNQLYDVGLLPLCAHTRLPLKTAEHILSFLLFLRFDQPSSSRAPSIKEICFSLEEYRIPLTKANYFDVQETDPSAVFAFPDNHPLVEERLLRESRNSALEAFLHILRHCRSIRRLHVERWFDDAPIALLKHAISFLHNLQDLRLPMSLRTHWGGDFKLANLPLQKLVLSPGRWVEIPDALTTLCPLADTLTELDIPVCQWVVPTGVTFPHVRKLGIEFPASDDVVSSLVRTFPALTHLALRGTRHFHLCHTHSSRQDEDRLREHSQYQWHALANGGAQASQLAGPTQPQAQAQDDAFLYTHQSSEDALSTVARVWPALMSVAAETACALYTLALPFSVSRVAVAYSAGEPAEDMLPTILADARPACLEIRVTQVHYRYQPLPRRFGGLQPRSATASLQRLVLTMEGDGLPDYVKVASILADELQRALTPLAVSHVLLTYSVYHFRASRGYTRKVVRTLCTDAPARAAALASAVPSLRYVAVRVRVQGGPAWLLCWEVVRPGPGAARSTRTGLPDRQAQVREFGDGQRRGVGLLPPTVVLREMSEDEGRDMLEAEGMVGGWNS
ncbi:hypothetical protein C8Q80DRAFT_1173066 [Daedaleopsis nitida]|nr:hypothetical protein C8Q80DRAFT_1173066 [Daedaleopsis nitida]